jgi:DNA-binding Xre family transcriptional regulator
MMPAELSDAARFKLALMAGIDEAIRSQHRTLVDAAVATGVNRQQLSRLRQGQHEVLSVSWLLKLAERLGVTLTIDVRISD